MNDTNNPSNPNYTPSDKPDASTVEGRRIIVALELLAKAVDKSTLATLHNIAEYAKSKVEDPTIRERHAERQAAARTARDKSQTQDWMKRAGMLKPRQKLTKFQRGFLKRIKNPRVRSAIRKEFRRRNAGRKAPGGAGGMAGLASMVQMFMRMLGPMALFAAVMGSAASGMELVSKGVRLMAAVFAPILLPVTVLLAVAMLALSDMIWSKLLPGLGVYFKFIMTIGIPVMQVFMNVVGNTINVWRTVAHVVVQLANTMIDVINKLNPLNKDIPQIPVPEMPNWANPDPFGASVEEEKKRKAIIFEEEERRNRRATEVFEAVGKENVAAGRPEHGPDDAGTAWKIAVKEMEERLVQRGVDPNAEKKQGMAGLDIKGLMQQVIQGLEFSAGPKASLGDLGAPRSAAQLAAVQADPFEKRIEQQFKQVIDILKQVAAELPDKQMPQMAAPAPAPGGPGFIGQFNPWGQR